MYAHFNLWRSTCDDDYMPPSGGHLVNQMLQFSGQMMMVKPDLDLSPPPAQLSDHPHMPPTSSSLPPPPYSFSPVSAANNPPSPYGAAVAAQSGGTFSPDSAYCSPPPYLEQSRPTDTSMEDEEGKHRARQGFKGIRVSHSVVVSALCYGWENPSSSQPIEFVLG